MVPDFNNVTFDKLSPEAVILGDIYKEFNWDSLNTAFQLIAKNDAILTADVVFPTPPF